ncbi:unnamed protein product, partial [marine sediment metagenome]
THNLRSVAVTTLNPTTDQRVDISINAYVVYDPTGASSYTSTTDTSLPSTFSDGNRMMFATLYILSGIIEKELLLEVAINSEDDVNIYTATTVTETNKGFDVVARA